MLKRNVSLALCLSVISGAAFAQNNNQGAGYIFEFGSPATSSGQLEGFLATAVALGSPLFNTTGPAGATQIIAKPDGTQFYMYGPGGVASFDPTFTTPSNINGLTGSVNQAAITPDGRYLLLGAGQSAGAATLYVLNTTNNAITISYPATGNIVGIAVSRDSKTAWVVTSSSQTSILVVNLQSQAVTTSVLLKDPLTDQGLGGGPTSISLSPLGLLYITAVNQILEINPPDLLTCIPNPATCKPVANTIPVNATGGPLQFTPDGTQAYFVNTTAQNGGQSLLRMSLPSHSIISWPKFVPGQTPEVFDTIAVISSTRILGHSVADTTIWDVAPDFSTVTVSALSSVVPATNATALAVSNELPTVQTAFVLVGGGAFSTIYRVNLSTNTVTSQGSAAFNSGVLEYVYIPQESNPSAFIQYNNPQTLAPGATAAPLIARVVDPAGRPVFGVPVTFTDPSGTLTFSNVSNTTNADGYVQATVTIPSTETPGTYPITLTAGTQAATVATTTFSITLPGATGPGTNGVNQMSIIGGNGGLYQAGQPRFGVIPLTVQVTDLNGNPLSGVAVTFQVTGANIASLDNPSTTTDVNGMASTDFFPSVPAQFTPFEATQVTASSTLGSVVFTETIFQTNPDGTGVPEFTVLQPSNTLVLTGGEGDVIPGAIQVAMFTTAFGTFAPIPNVAIRIADANNPQNNGPGTCQGNPLSDQTGNVTCNFIPSCSAGLGLHGFDIILGEFNQKNDYAVNITTGSTVTLNVGSGNQQTGNPGAALGLPLVAQVTDQCGSPLQGVPVTWKVTQGAATLSNSTTASNQGGNASIRATLGQATGTVQITATVNNTASVTFTETINTVAGTLTLVSGGGQSALIGQAFTAPLVFQLNDTKGSPIVGFQVNFSVVAGSAPASLSVGSATTNAQGQVSVNVTAGNTAGSITISAIYNTLNATATLTSKLIGPGITVSSFVNAASLQAGLAPCGLASVTGSGLAPNLNGTVSGNPLGIGLLPYTLNGVTITVNLVPAPILSVSNQNGAQQVNFQTPCETVPGGATVTVQVNASSTTVNNVPVYAAEPGIFTYAGPSGTLYGWVISASNGSYLTPSNFAHAGQSYYLVVTGMGQTTPPASTNTAGTGSQTIPAPLVQLAINNIGVPVNTVQYVQGEIGEYIIGFTIPSVFNGAAFPTGTNMPISLGVLVGGQVLYDTAPVALPGIQ